MSVKRPRILIINVYPSINGTEPSLAMACALAKAGHRVDVYTRRDAQDTPPTACPAVGVKLTRLDVGPAEALDEAALLRLVPALVTAAKRQARLDGPFDLVHGHRLISGLVGQRLKEDTGWPLVASFDVLGLSSSAEKLPNDPIGQIRVDVERRIMAHADKVLAQCPGQLTDLHRLYGLAERSLTLVPPGVDTSVFHPVDRAQARARLGIGEDEFLIVHASKLLPHKGVDNIIRAVGLQRSQVRARLSVIGGQPANFPGDEVQRLGELARQCGVADQVEFLGPSAQSDLSCHFAAADVVVDTPWYEPLGDAPLEAMACGTPVIASDVGGARHTVDDGVTGFLVRPRDPLGLAGRIEQIHGNPALARRMGHAGVARAQTHFGWDHIAERLAATYHAVQTQVALDQASACTEPLAFSPWMDEPLGAHDPVAPAPGFNWAATRPAALVGPARAGADVH